MPNLNENGLVVYEGPSFLDGSPIVAIITALVEPSDNDKTGDMVQLWILPRDRSPIEARKTKDDSGFCGKCTIKSACYLDWGKAPMQVWRCHQRGGYDYFDPDWDSVYLLGRKLRLGAAGDPCALPYRLVRDLVDMSTGGHAGYTHQWRENRYRAFQRFVMASVESWGQALEAQSRGWRTFRILKPGESPTDTETRCPASKEGGMVTNCENCQLCAGLACRARSVAITAHGPKAKLHYLLPILESAAAT